MQRNLSTCKNAELRLLKNCVSIVRHPVGFHYRNKLEVLYSEISNLEKSISNKISDIRLEVIEYRAEKTRFMIFCNSINEVSQKISHSDICRVTEHGNNLSGIANNIFAMLSELKFNDCINLEAKKKKAFEYTSKLSNKFSGVTVNKRFNEYKVSIQTYNVEENINKLIKFIDISII